MVDRIGLAKTLRTKIMDAPTRDDLEAQADDLRAQLAAVEAQIVPAWKQPTGAHDAYPIGARVFYEGRAWTSLVAANVWPPGTAGMWG